VCQWVIQYPSSCGRLCGQAGLTCSGIFFCAIISITDTNFMNFVTEKLLSIVKFHCFEGFLVYLKVPRFCLHAVTSTQKKTTSKALGIMFLFKLLPSKIVLVTFWNYLLNNLALWIPNIEKVSVFLKSDVFCYTYQDQVCIHFEFFLHDNVSFTRVARHWVN
jgi:hypothetical protein